MEILHILGYLGALLIGLSLGLIGGGGSILAVPVLAYLFAVNEQVATAYSLFIVGSSSLLGGIKQHLKGFVQWKTAFLFGVPAIFSVTIVRHLLIPALPENLFSVGDFVVTRRLAMFGLFALLMIPAAISMLKTCKNEKVKSHLESPSFAQLALLAFEGLVIGFITGFIGAGGGFLIIPALVMLAKLEMKEAVGTSLIIIALNSLVGFFLGDVFTIAIDWFFLIRFTALSYVGIFLGSYLGNFIDGKRLKKAFGYFIIVMAAFIFYMELVVKHSF
ncbi:sulfite exporter TauE/SafE family protein [Zhouia sp. PK063]|uniref:sulfite exporter TauE/SafE family protein n=1 Tax=Zhouia sp. PK063 TaxID=3373602 RepID=UPI00379F1CAD